MRRQHRKYTVLLQEHGRVLQEYTELEQEVEELDKERSALKHQLKNFLHKIGFSVTPDFIDKLEQC